MRKQRTTHFRNTNSKSGELSIRITSNELASRLRAYAKSENKPCQAIVNEALNEYLANREKDLFMQMSKEDLIEMLLDERRKS